MKHLQQLLSQLKSIKNFKIWSVIRSINFINISYSKLRFSNLKTKRWLYMSILMVPPLIAGYLIVDFFTEIENLKGIRYKAARLELEASRQSIIKQNEKKWIDQLSRSSRNKSIREHFPKLVFKVHETRKANKIVEQEISFEKPQLLNSDELLQFFIFLEDTQREDCPQYIVKSFDLKKILYEKKEPTYYLNINLIERRGND